MGRRRRRTAGSSAMTAGGKPLNCIVCSHTRFTLRNALLNTRWATFFDFDWANRSATCAVCENCGFVHWFLDAFASEEGNFFSEPFGG